MFTHPMTVRMYDTDAAGILYFGNQFRFVHDTFESLMNSHGFSFHTLLFTEEFLFVIVHASSDYKLSLTVGDNITVKMGISRIGTTSFTCDYQILKEDGQLAGTAQTVHVCLDRATHTKRPLPEKALSVLQGHLV